MNHVAGRYKSLANLVRIEGGTIQANPDGTVQATERFRCYYKDVFKYLPIRYVTEHPIFPFLIAHSWSIQEEVTSEPGMPGWCTLSITYFGVAGDLPPPDIEILDECSDVPIQAHKYFKEWIKAEHKGTDGKRWAVFDPETTQWVGFSNHSPLTGVTSYMGPNVIVRKTFITRGQPDPNTVKEVVGKITSDGWLLVRWPVIRLGGIWKNVQEYYMPGPRFRHITSDPVLQQFPMYEKASTSTIPILGNNYNGSFPRT